MGILRPILPVRGGDIHRFHGLGIVPSILGADAWEYERVNSPVDDGKFQVPFKRCCRDIFPHGSHIRAFELARFDQDHAFEKIPMPGGPMTIDMDQASFRLRLAFWAGCSATAEGSCHERR